jgi:superfamily II DNA/RNA helicase
MSTFNELKISQQLILGLTKEKIVAPADIQNEMIPLALENKDIIAQSVTGSGKTLAYLLPIFQRLNIESKDPQAIILAPTHELCKQIYTEIEKLNENSNFGVRSALLIGQANAKRQEEKLKEKPHIIVGSSGRVLEHIKNKKLKTHFVKTIVIDEADKLIDKEHVETVEAIIKSTLKDRQLIAVSATIRKQTLETAKQLMKQPVVLKVDEEQVNSNITHEYILAEYRDKVLMVRKVLARFKPKKTIIFVNKNEMIQDIVEQLRYHQVDVVGLFGNASKGSRQRSIEAFKMGKSTVLVSSDIAARGIDIPDITHIINLDLPRDSEEYLHRVGRTGRYDQKGFTISIITSRERSFLQKIERELSIEANELTIFKTRHRGDRMTKPTTKNKTETN